MVVSDANREAMLQAAKPLMKWLAENTNPHCTAIVHAAHIEPLEGVATNSTLDFVHDGPGEIAA